MLTLTIQSLREARHAPYFFLRRQAQQRMQSYSLSTIGLLIVTVGLVAYVWNPPQDNSPQFASLTNSKPTAVEIAQRAPLIAPVESLLQTTARPLVVPQTADAAAATAVDELPPEFNTLDPQTPLNRNTRIADLAFATQIDDQYNAVGARRTFGEGFYTLYATFEYAAMADGMEWSWVWRFNGQVIGGGNELWNYGADGPGYIYFSPEEGFSEGEYSLQVFVNDSLVSQQSLTISAGAANN